MLIQNLQNLQRQHSGQAPRQGNIRSHFQMVSECANKQPKAANPQGGGHHFPFIS